MWFCLFENFLLQVFSVFYSFQNLWKTKIFISQICQIFEFLFVIEFCLFILSISYISFTRGGKKSISFVYFYFFYFRYSIKDKHRVVFKITYQNINQHHSNIYYFLQQIFFPNYFSNINQQPTEKKLLICHNESKNIWERNTLCLKVNISTNKNGFS